MKRRHFLFLASGAAVGALRTFGFLGAKVEGVSNALQQYNPLFFDFVLKRSLRFQVQGLAPSVFETRKFFETAL